MKEFCNEVLKFLESEYGNMYTFAIVLESSLEWTEAVLTIKFDNCYTMKVCRDMMNYLYRTWRNNTYIEERGQYVWQKDLVDIIEGS